MKFRAAPLGEGDGAVSDEELGKRFIASATTLDQLRFAIENHPKLAGLFQKSEKYFYFVSTAAQKKVQDLDGGELEFLLDDARSSLIAVSGRTDGCENVRDLVGRELVSRGSSSEVMRKVIEFCCPEIEQRATKLLNARCPGQETKLPV